MFQEQRPVILIEGKETGAYLECHNLNPLLSFDLV